MKRFTALVVTLLLFNSCKNEIRTFSHFSATTRTIHIICDARKTGKVEPWMIEFSNKININIDLTQPAGLFWPSVAQFELGTTTELIKVEYLGEGMPLLETGSLYQVLSPIGIADTAYKHYYFLMNPKLQGKPLFKFMKDDDHDGVINAPTNYVTVLLSTNDTSLTRAVASCNRYLVDSLPNKRFGVTHD